MINYIEKMVAAVTGTVGVVVSTEQVVIQVNYIFIIAAVMSSLLASYGLYHLITDLKKNIRKY